jgi:hypothetical protein
MDCYSEASTNTPAVDTEKGDPDQVRRSATIKIHGGRFHCRSWWVKIMNGIKIRTIQGHQIQIFSRMLRVVPIHIDRTESDRCRIIIFNSCPQNCFRGSIHSQGH